MKTRTFLVVVPLALALGLPSLASAAQSGTPYLVQFSKFYNGGEERCAPVWTWLPSAGVLEYLVCPPGAATLQQCQSGVKPDVLVYQHPTRLNPGTYKFSVTARNAVGWGLPHFDTVVIKRPEDTDRVDAFFSSPRVSGLTAIFTAANPSILGNGASFFWDFGDGLQGTGQTISHAYKAKGRYTVRLTVTDQKSCRTSSFKSTNVAVG